jgi:hypothetical protein
MADHGLKNDKKYPIAPPPSYLPEGPKKKLLKNLLIFNEWSVCEGNVVK